MKIVIATPLYPPEIGSTAVYVKELAKRLSLDNKVTIITYGNVYENIDNVEIITVNKNLPLPYRLFLFTYQLIKNKKRADIIYAENGLSVELPVGISALLTFRPFILHNDDLLALENSKKGLFTSLLTKFLSHLSKEITTDVPKEKQEILPFSTVPEESNKEYESSWKEHITLLQDLFKKHGK